jgi:hypothetical protein
MANLFSVNQHPVERGIRALVGVALIGLAAFGTIGAWGYLGVIPLVTGLSGMCPLYSMIGISTCPAKNRAALR